MLYNMYTYVRISGGVGGTIIQNTSYDISSTRSSTMIVL